MPYHEADRRLLDLSSEQEGVVQEALQLLVLLIALVAVAKAR